MNQTKKIVIDSCAPNYLRSATHVQSGVLLGDIAEAVPATGRVREVAQKCLDSPDLSETFIARLAEDRLPERLFSGSAC
jgi:hypothetical protein